MLSGEPVGVLTRMSTGPCPESPTSCARSASNVRARRCCGVRSRTTGSSVVKPIRSATRAKAGPRSLTAVRSKALSFWSRAAVSIGLEVRSNSQMLDDGPKRCVRVQRRALVADANSLSLRVPPEAPW